MGELSLGLTGVWSLSSEQGWGALARLQHGGLGFVHVVPGQPSLLGMDSDGQGVSVRLTELAIVLRYRLTMLGPVASAQDMAKTLLEHHMLGRQRSAMRVQDVPSGRLKAWGVAGAAKSFYSLREGVEPGMSSELTLMLVRGSAAMTISCLFHADTLDWMQWAVFESAIFHQLAWAQALNNIDPFWPEGVFLESSLDARLRPEAQALVEQMAADVMTISGLENTSDTFRELRRRLRVCIVDHRAPSLAISSRVRDGLRQFLVRQVANPLLVRHLNEQISRIQTAHDLRGMAIMFERAIEQVLRWRKGLA